MQVTLPDDPALAGLTEAEIRLDLACALYARERVSRLVATRIAGVELQVFDEELGRRTIPTYTEEMLDQDLESIRNLFGR